MPFQIIRNDITKVTADAIVNTANPEPVYAEGTDFAIYTAAGAEELLAERRKIGPIKTGDAAATPAFRLSARYIIHTVGPVWQGGDHGELEDLSSCYRNSLLLAAQLHCESIAFPLISAGVYGFPKDWALKIAMQEIQAFLLDHEMDVTLVVFNKEAFELSTGLVRDVRQYIDDNYAGIQSRAEYGSFHDTIDASRRRRRMAEEIRSISAARPNFPTEESDMAQDREVPDRSWRYSDRKEAREKKAARAKKPSSLPGLRPKKDLSDLMTHLGETFQERLLRMIDEKGLTDAEVYKNANVDRKLFSKIRCNPNYKPGKRTAVALAVALHLNLDETVDLLGRAGLALSPGSVSDLIVRYCIENGIYDIYEINLLLFEYDQPLLGY